MEAQFQAPVLSFALNTTATSTLARRGELTFTTPSLPSPDSPQLPPRVISTPAVVAYTSRGALPHLTRDNVARLPTEMAHVALEHLLEMVPPPFVRAPFSLHRYMGLQESKKQRQPILTMSLCDPSCAENTPTNSNTVVMANTSRGVLKVSPAQFLLWSLPRPADILIAMEDSIAGAASATRIQKSVGRTLRWVAEISHAAKARTNVFAPLVGSSSARQRKVFAESLLDASGSAGTAPDDDIAGYALTLDEASRATPFILPSLFLDSLGPLPSSKPRLVLSAAGPHDILRLIRDVGLDLFVDEWSPRCATLGLGLDFAFPVPTPSDPPLPLGSAKLDIGHSFFDYAFAEAFVPLSSSPLAVPRPPRHSTAPFDEPYSPFGPSPPTRGYVHHLLKSHEMTAHVILALHNAIVMDAFFASIRRLLDAGGEAFAREVAKFFEVYEEGTPFSGGEYECVRSAEKELEVVQGVRGKRSVKAKAEAEAVAEALERRAEEEGESVLG